MPRLALARPVPLPEEDPILCDLAAITGFNHPTSENRASFTYKIILRHPRYSAYPAHIKVPANYVAASIQEEFQRHGVVHIFRASVNQGRATMGDLVASDETARFRHLGAEGVYFREVEVLYRRFMFHGEIAIPRTGQLIDLVDECTALPSVEPVDEPELLERRTVSFKHARSWFQGYRYDVEIWGVNGEDSFEGKAKVVRVDSRRTGRRNMHGSHVLAWRVVLLTEVPDDRHMVLLRGEMVDGMSVGRFEMLEDA